MFHSVMMFLVPGQGLPALPESDSKPGLPMATRQALAGRPASWKVGSRMILSIVADSLGLVLFLTGLWVVLRLAEVLLS